MPVPTTEGAGSGWHPDPNDPTKLRWRDATGWTDHVAPLPAAPRAATDGAPFVATVADPPADALSAALETARAARSGLVMAQPWSGGVTATAPAPRGQAQAVSPPAEPVAEPEPEATTPETTDAGAAKPSPSPAQKPAGLALRARRLRARRRAAEAAVPDPATEPVLAATAPEPAAQPTPTPAATAEPTPRDAEGPAAAAQPDPVAEEATPATDAGPVRPSRKARRRAAAAAAVAAIGAGGAFAAVQLGGTPVKTAAHMPVTAADRACMRLWNIGTSSDDAQLRVTLGQFTGAYGRVSRVAPLGGTLMEADSCALTVYDRSDRAHAIFVAGVRDERGYIDVTNYPRAERYHWPRTARQSNVRILADGSLQPLS